MEIATFDSGPDLLPPQSASQPSARVGHSKNTALKALMHNIRTEFFRIYQESGIQHPDITEANILKFKSRKILDFQGSENLNCDLWKLSTPSKKELLRFAREGKIRVLKGEYFDKPQSARTGAAAVNEIDDEDDNELSTMNGAANNNTTAGFNMNGNSSGMPVSMPPPATGAINSPLLATGAVHKRRAPASPTASRKRAMPSTTSPQFTNITAAAAAPTPNHSSSTPSSSSPSPQTITAIRSKPPAELHVEPHRNENGIYVEQVHGLNGRPKYQIYTATVHELKRQKFKLEQIAKMHGVSPRTIKRRLNEEKRQAAAMREAAERGEAPPPAPPMHGSLRDGAPVHGASRSGNSSRNMHRQPSGGRLQSLGAESDTPEAEQVVDVEEEEPSQQPQQVQQDYGDAMAEQDALDMSLPEMPTPQQQQPQIQRSQPPPPQPPPQQQMNLAAFDFGAGLFDSSTTLAQTAAQMQAQGFHHQVQQHHQPQPQHLQRQQQQQQQQQQQHQRMQMHSHARQHSGSQNVNAMEVVRRLQMERDSAVQYGKRMEKERDETKRKLEEVVKAFREEEEVVRRAQERRRDRVREIFEGGG